MTHPDWNNYRWQFICGIEGNLDRYGKELRFGLIKILPNPDRAPGAMIERGTDYKGFGFRVFIAARHAAFIVLVIHMRRWTQEIAVVPYIEVRLF